MTPETRKEKYLAKASGDYSGELPEPVTREEKYLFKIAESGGDGDGDSSAYAHSLELSINSQTYVLTATLKNTSGEALGTPQTIDLPLETMVVGGSYDDTTKKVILTLKNGNTVDFSVADLVSGLQSEITSSNKLNSDLVDDTNQNNKFVTSAEKTKLAGIETGANKITVDSALDSTSVNPVRNSAIYTALSNKVNKVTGKQLSTEDFTTAEKTKLAGLQNYNDASCIKNIFGTPLANGDDLNTYTDVGTYACTSGAVASSLINCPYTGSGFRLDVFQTSSVNFLKQIVQPNQTGTDSSIYHRTYAVSTDSWSAWYRLTSEALPSEL